MHNEKMNSKECLSNFVIFHGPPFVGKSSYFANELSGAFECVSPSNLLQTAATLSLRQLINSYIIKPLLRGEKVVVDDCMQTASLRRSYISTVLSKVPNVKCTCVIFRPEFGKEQLKWKREFRLAEAVLKQDRCAVDRIISTDVDLWYEDCEPVSDGEEASKLEVVLPLQIDSPRLFTIPGLIIESKGVVDAELVSLMQTWSNHNSHGRIIAIYESKRNSKMEDEEKSVLELLKHIQRTSDLVVYAYHVDGSGYCDLTSFTTSVIAFLMRFHCLDLLSANSVYLFDSVKHRKMAEAVGMRHIKLSRAVTNLDLLCHGTVQFPCPKMLQCMQVLPLPTSEETSPKLPLLQNALDSDNCIGKVSIGRQRAIYIAAKNPDTLNRWQRQQLETTSSPLTNPCNTTSASTSASHGAKGLRKKKRPSSGFVPLPSWMTSKRRRTQKSGSEKDRDQRSGKVLPSTVYVMTEEELLSTALMVLREDNGAISDEERPMEKGIERKDSSDVSESVIFQEGKNNIMRKKAETERDCILDEVFNDTFNDTRRTVHHCSEHNPDYNKELHKQLISDQETELRTANIRKRSKERYSAKALTPSSASKCDATTVTPHSTKSGISVLSEAGVKVGFETMKVREPAAGSDDQGTSLSLYQRTNGRKITTKLANKNANEIHDMTILDEVLGNDISEVGTTLEMQDFIYSKQKYAADKARLKTIDSDISKFIDSLIN